MRTPPGRSLVAAVLAVAFLSQAAPGSALAAGWKWPVPGPVITPYSNDNGRPYAAGMHRGIDIAAPLGEPVVAAHSGRVTYAGRVGSAGLTVAIRGSDGRHVTSYLHLGSIEVTSGQALAGGEKLGTVGSTGRPSAAEPHLHFGLRLAERDRFYIDPLSVLPPPGGARSEPLPGEAPAAARQRARPALAPVAVRAQAVPSARLDRGLVLGSGARAPSRDWGKLLTIAGLALLIVALARRHAIAALWAGVAAIERIAQQAARTPGRFRLARLAPSGARRGQQGAKPAAPPATTSRPAVGPVSQMS